MIGPSRVGTVRNSIALIVLAAAIAGGAYLTGRASRPLAEPGSAEAVAPPPAPSPAVAVPEQVLTRSDLIRLGSAAADRWSGGDAPIVGQAGRRFRVRIPFGCGRPGEAEAGPLTWNYDAATETLRIRVASQQWVDAPAVVEQLSGRGIESVEGFWLPRPWTSSDRCPAWASGPEQPPSSLGIAQFFTGDSDRASQRGDEPLTLVRRITRDAFRPSTGFALVVEGRVARVPGSSGTALCQADGPYQRPTCLIGATFDRISIENPADGESLGEWAF